MRESAWQQPFRMCNLQQKFLSPTESVKFLLSTENAVSCRNRNPLHNEQSLKGLCNFVSNFLVAQEKLHEKLQARAIISTRDVGFSLHGFLLRATFLPMWFLYFHWETVWHALCTLVFDLVRLSTLSKQMFVLKRIWSNYLVLATSNTIMAKTIHNFLTLNKLSNID